MKYFIIPFLFLNLKLYGVEKYVGYKVENRYNPAIGYLIIHTEILKNMRLNGLYGPKESSPYVKWRQSMFESFKKGDYNRNVENDLPTFLWQNQKFNAGIWQEPR